MVNSKIIAIDNTNFIFETNFSGDPARDKYGDRRRKANILIADPEQARDLMEAGFKVKETKPGRNCPDPENFVPQYHIVGLLKYRKDNGEPVKWPPKVVLLTGKDLKETELDEETAGTLDHIRVKNVNVILNPRIDPENDKKTLYIRTMYVEQDMDDDPYAEMYRRRRESAGEEPW